MISTKRVSDIAELLEQLVRDCDSTTCYNGHTMLSQGSPPLDVCYAVIGALAREGKHWRKMAIPATNLQPMPVFLAIEGVSPRPEQTGAAAAVDPSNTLPPEVLALIAAARAVAGMTMGNRDVAMFLLNDLHAALTPFDRTEKT